MKCATMNNYMSCVYYARLVRESYFASGCDGSHDAGIDAIRTASERDVFIAGRAHAFAPSD